MVIALSGKELPQERADVAQSVERILGKDEVAGSNPAISSIKSFGDPEGFFYFQSSKYKTGNAKMCIPCQSADKTHKRKNSFEG